MANEDVVKLRGVSGEFKDSRGGAAIIPSAVLGIVKNNVDPTHSGRLEVYLKRMGSGNPDNQASWTTVRYLSPFFGYTPNTGNPSGYGDYVGNPNSYGFWATPPDIGTEVVCIFLNGDSSEGYYIGCVPQPGMTQMVPAIGAVDNVIPNDGEAKSYGGSSRLPVGEANNANDKQANAPRQTDNPKPVHTYQAAIYNKQGLLRDPDRGPISSSSMRESPSRVFGISTPGRPIYQGGYNDETITKAATDPNIPGTNLKVIGRVGGHTLVMDDGDIKGKDQLVRLRTTNGHTILMNDAAQTLFIIHANGQSYIELGKEGTIDLYSTNSVNIRTQGDLNLHADRNININAAKNFNINAENVQIESEKQTNIFSGTNFSQYVKGNFTNKVDGSMSMYSTGEASLASSGTTYINGPSAINLNTGSSGLIPQKVKQVTKVKHTDTLYDATKGFAAAPGKLESITSRAPAHSPWADANKGVDVKTNLSASANFPASAPTTVNNVNQAAGTTPSNPTTPPLVSTVPNTGTGTRTLTQQQTNAVASAMAVNAATNNTTADAVKQTAGTAQTSDTPTAVLGAFAVTPSQLTASGYIKPGADIAINTAIQNGQSIQDAIPPNVWTGKNGINNTSDFLSSQTAQLDASKTLIAKSEKALIEKGLLTGKESGLQTAGLILATASSGLGPVNNFLKSFASGTTASPLQVSNILNNAPESLSKLGNSLSDALQKTGLGLKATPNLTGDVTSVVNAISPSLPQGSLNNLAGPVGGLIASGNLAANLADKAMSGLPTTNSTSVENTSKGLFDKIVAGFKDLQSKIPQNLTAINAKNKAEQDVTTQTTSETPPDVAKAAAEASKQANEAIAKNSNAINILNNAFGSIGNKIGLADTGSISGISGLASTVYGFVKNAGTQLKETPPDPSGIGNLPGGAQSVTNTLTGNFPQSIPGTDKLKEVLSSISSGTSGTIDTAQSSINDLKNKLTNTNLSSFTSVGLSSSDLAALQGAVNSLSAGGGAEVKLPTVAEGTNNLDELMSQFKNLFGPGSKIPMPNFGNIKPKDLSPADTETYNKLQEELDTLTDTYYDLNKVYLDYNYKYGPNAAETVAAKQALDQCVKDKEKIQQKMSNLSSGSSI